MVVLGGEWWMCWSGPITNETATMIWHRAEGRKFWVSEQVLITSDELQVLKEPEHRPAPSPITSVSSRYETLCSCVEDVTEPARWTRQEGRRHTWLTSASVVERSETSL